MGCDRNLRPAVVARRSWLLGRDNVAELIALDA